MSSTMDAAEGELLAILARVLDIITIAPLDDWTDAEISVIPI